MESISSQQEQKADQKRTALVFFTDTPELRWWDYLARTRPGFRHCFLAYWHDWSQRWIIVDWRSVQLDILVNFPFEMEQVEQFADKWNGTVVEVEVPELQGKSLPVLMYCTTVIAHFLGLKNRLILTPWRLYRILLANGGKVVRPRGTEHGSIFSESEQRAESSISSRSAT